MSELPLVQGDAAVVELVRRAVLEDLGPGDVTTEALVATDAEITAVILARRDLVMAGGGIAEAVFHRLDGALLCELVVPDGERAVADAPLLRVTGRAAAILTAERTALNFMQRLSGIATLTRAFVDKVAGSGVRIVDTRKTTPGMRILEKYAVLCGGGENHRMGLYDRVLIKDNHRRFWSGGGGLRLDEAVREARRRMPGLVIEVEVESEAELENALAAEPDWVMLDNMTPADLRRCVKLCDGRARLEASGGITLETVSEIAASGVDAISLGCLTHSAPAVDMSLEIEGAA